VQHDHHENERKRELKMSNPFFEHPILNSPYACPQRHWELDGDGQPTQQIIEERRKAEFTDVYEIESDFAAKVAARFDEMIGKAVHS